MGKGKGRGDEHAARVNYLFQAGKMMTKDLPQLSQYYGQVLTVITEKTAPKKDFTMKRSMCKRCHAVLQIGENATYRLRKNRRRKSAPNIIIGCLLCGEKKRLPTTKGYRLYAETNGQIIDGNSANGNRHAPPRPSPSLPLNENSPNKEIDNKDALPHSPSSPSQK